MELSNGMCNGMGPASVESSTQSYCGVKDPCFVSTTLLHFFLTFSLFISLLVF